MKKDILTIILISLMSLNLRCSDDSTGSGYHSSGQDGMPSVKDIIVPDLEGDIELKHGQRAIVESENLEIEFSRVLLESRCPENAVCAWEGQVEVEILLSRPDIDPSSVVTILKPGTDPYENQYLSACALEYRIILLSALPYPSQDHETEPDDYEVTVRVRKEPLCCDPHSVQFTWASPASLQRDAFSITDCMIEENTLIMRVQYGGGCREHDLRLFMQPTFMESYPVQAALYLQHDAHRDMCEALITEEVRFDIRKISWLYYRFYNGYDDIILNIYGYFEDTRNDPCIAVYSPR